MKINFVGIILLNAVFMEISSFSEISIKELTGLFFGNTCSYKIT